MLAAGRAQDADHQVPDGGSDVGAGAGPCGGGVLADGDAATQWSWFSVCRRPRIQGQLLGTGPARRQRGDRIAGIGAPPAAGTGTGDLDGPGCVPDCDPGGHRDGLDDAFLDPAAVAAVLHVASKKVLSGRPGELAGTAEDLLEALGRMPDQRDSR